MPERHEGSGVAARRRELFVLCAYMVLSAIATFPLVLKLGQAVPGAGDAWVFYWDLWWVKRALVELGASPYFTGDLHFPYGASLYFHTLNLASSVLAIPVVAIAGLTRAYNIIVLLAFATSGYAMYRLALHELQREVNDREALDRSAYLASFLSGLVFTFSSYHFAHATGHLDLTSTQWLPLTALFVLKTGREPGWRNPLIVAALLVMTALTASYYFVFVMLFVAMAMARSIVERLHEWGRSSGRLLSAVVLAAVVLLPMLTPMLTADPSVGRVPDPAYDVDRFSADLLAFAIPSSLHTFWGSAFTPVYRLMTGANSGIEGIVFLGYVPMALALTGMRASPRPRMFWVLALIVFGLLALGPVMHVGGYAVHGATAVMPYRLLSALPQADVMRVPARFVVMVLLCLSVLVAQGVRTCLLGLSESRELKVAVLLGVLCFVETMVVPFPMSAVHVPPFYDRLNLETRRVGVLEVPIPDEPSAYPIRMLYQTHHQLPVYGGYLSRGRPPLEFGALPGFGQFKTSSDRLDDVVPYDSHLPEISRVVLDAYSVGYVVIEKDRVDPATLARLRAVAESIYGASSLEFEDSQTLAYAAPLSPGPPAPAAVWLDSGWSYLESMPSPSGKPNRWRWMGRRSRLGFSAPEPTTARLAVVAGSLRRNRRLRPTIGDEEIATFVATPGTARYETPSFRLPAGINFLTLESLDGEESPDPPDLRRLSVAMHRIELMAE